MRTKRILAMAAMAMMAVAMWAQQCPVSVKWRVGENQARTFTAYITIKNISGETLDGGWALYYNKFSNTIKMADGQPLDLKPVVNFNYVCLSPNESYKPLKPGEELTVTVVSGGSFRNISDKPDGMHFVAEPGGKAVAVKVDVAPLENYNQFSVSRFQNYADGNYVYKQNAMSNPDNQDCDVSEFAVMPMPKEITLNAKGERIDVPSEVAVVSKSVYLTNAKNYLLRQLQRLGVSDEAKAKFKITLDLEPAISDNREYYVLEVGKKGIGITGQSAEAVLNGVKTLSSVLEFMNCKQISCARVVDYPDFHYRGMMLDISRNFTPYADLLDFIDRLAEYKVNVLQLHFCDDEAWRLEIPGLPELTEVGARKGYTLNDYEAGFMMQTYAGSGNPDDGKAPANGFITRSQFVEMLKYAHERGVKIIPEIETPGHARAAIVAMRYRYKKYIDTDAQKANYYRCYDLDDKGRYESAQGFGDNVLNVAEPGTYQLIMKVVREMQKMYAEAGLRLDVVHLGGDEVAKGCWDNSPKVKQLMKENGFKNERDVAEHYFVTISKWLAEQGIKVEGWQEVSTGHSDEYNAKVNPRLAGVNVWSTIGSRDTIAYSLANRGVPVILSNVGNLYLDMVYRMHEYENGLTWGGCVDEITSFETLPFNIYRSVRTTYNGNEVNLDKAAQGKPDILRKDCILGLQAQLWAETIRDYGMVQEYVFPKIFGLVERSWNASPEWGEGSLNNEKYLADRAAYSMRIGRRELPHLNRVGASFHLAQPGAVVENGMLKVNTPFSGVEVRYTFDGAEPTEQSPLWTAPVAVPDDVKQIKAKAYYLGKTSVTTRLMIK
ncbi:MAG: family 20 glycosylhydrolase [Muribaculaceae bacterium]